MAGPNEPFIIDIGPTVDIIVKDDGAVAWVAEQFRAPAAPAEYQVIKVDRYGERLLASGMDIDPHSLVLGGSMLYWTQGGKPSSATLN